MKLIYCKSCEQVLSAPKSGERVTCHCGKSHIQKVGSFCHRYGGEAVPFEAVPGEFQYWAQRAVEGFTETEKDSAEMWGIIPFTVGVRVYDRHEFRRESVKI